MKANIISLLILPALLASCASSTVQTKESQAALTPVQAVQRLQAGNQRFATGNCQRRNLPAQVKRTATGQHPLATVLGCMDSRTSNELIFDQGLGDIFSTRIAGNVLNDDLLGSLEFAAEKMGVKAIVVLGHTRCGAVIGACSHAKLGHLTGLLEKIQPAVRKVAASSPQPTGAAFEDAVAAENVRQVVRQIRAQSPILRDLERQGKLVITGALYHLETGKVEFF